MGRIKNLSESPLFLQITPDTPAKQKNRLIVAGQGVVKVQPKLQQPFSLRLTDSTDERHWLELSVGQGSALITLQEQGEEPLTLGQCSAGLDPDPACFYWLSLDSLNHEVLRYGKGEARTETTLLTATLPAAEVYEWIKQLDGFILLNGEGAPAELAGTLLWRDPVVAPPPLVVVHEDDMTMDLAATSTVTVVENLSPACQRLYATVAGAKFQLNTPDFPFFAEAIEQSIVDPNGWCCQTLKAKASEFGSDDPSATYLRITLGQNLGNSPGVPYVMEIWPAGHHSPIHNHAGAFAVIKVLYGEIHVELFDMLSVYHQTPFAEKDFSQGAVTWLAPQLNQTHRLSNPNRVGPCCVTIQCYQYGEENRVHYEYFDYIDNQGTGIGHFEPNSDMDFLPFKALMKQEWEQRNRGK